MSILVSKKVLEDLYLTQHLSTRAISRKLNIPRTTILNRLVQFDIPRRTISEAVSGKYHYRWVGRTLRREGYVWIHLSTHPRCNGQGYVLEHRLVMEKYLGRYLTAEEVVHHENEIRNDNRIENLKLFCNQNAHIKYHNLKRGKK